MNNWTDTYACAQGDVICTEFLTQSQHFTKFLKTFHCFKDIIKIRKDNFSWWCHINLHIQIHTIKHHQTGLSISIPSLKNYFSKMLAYLTNCERWISTIHIFAYSQSKYLNAPSITNRTFNASNQMLHCFCHFTKFSFRSTVRWSHTKKKGSRETDTNEKWNRIEIRTLDWFRLH